MINNFKVMDLFRSKMESNGMSRLSCVFLMCLMFVLLSATSFSTTISNGLVAYYPFNGNANDESGNGRNGTVNGPTLANDRFGNPNSAYSFDGNDFIQIQNSPQLHLSPTGSFTISAWVNYLSTQSSWKAILAKSPSEGVWNYGLYISPSNTYMSGLHTDQVVYSNTQASGWQQVRNYSFSFSSDSAKMVQKFYQFWLKLSFPPSFISSFQVNNKIYKPKGDDSTRSIKPIR